MKFKIVASVVILIIIVIAVMVNQGRTTTDNQDGLNNANNVSNDQY